MPVSNDNQDFGQSDEKSKQNNTTPVSGDKLTSDDLKGKKVDRDPEVDEDEPLQQQK